MKKNIQILIRTFFAFFIFANLPMLAPQSKNNNETIQKDNLDSNKKNDNKKQDANIYLNIKDTSLKNVVNYIADQKKINLIPHKDLENLKVSMSTRTPLTLDQAWTILQTLLETNNFSMVNVNNIYRIIPNNISKQQPLPSYVDTEIEDLPDSDIMIRYVYLFKNIKSHEIQPILNSMLEPKSVLYNENLNACFISEKSFNIKAAMKIIKELDTSGLRESIQIIQLEEANAEGVAKLFNEYIIKNTQQTRQRPIINLTQQKQAAFFSKSTRIISDPRTNRLILLGTKSNIEKIRNFIKKYIDKPIDSPDSRIHVKELKYADSEKIAQIVESVIKPPVQTSKTLVGHTKFFEDMTIAAEPSAEEVEKASISVGAGNRLLIASTKEDWLRIEAFIDKLDKPQPQVAIEVLFVDVKQLDQKSLGAELRNKKMGTLGYNNSFETRHLESAVPTNAAPNTPFHIPIPPTPPAIKSMINVASQNTSNHPAYLTIGKKGNIWAIVRSVLSTDNFNIISQPYLVASNNQQSTLAIKENKTMEGEISTSSVLVVKERVERNAKIEVKLTPGINKEGTINLILEIDIEEFQEGTDFRNRRNLKTQTTMTDGEVLVLGGLTQDEITDDIYSTPILSKIPLLGNLFKQRTRQVERKDLFIFIRPCLIKPRFEGKPGEYTQLKLDYTKLQLQKHEDYYAGNDPIQKWFFAPPKKRGETKSLATLKDQDIQPIINFTEGRYQPKSVVLGVDPYYRPSESTQLLKYQKKSISRRKARQIKRKEKIRLKKLKKSKNKKT